MLPTVPIYHKNCEKRYKEKLVYQSHLSYLWAMQTISATHKRLGNRIKELRKEKNMTQEDLAFKVSVDRSYMGFVERGEKNPTLDKLIKIAQSLSVSLSELFKSI